MKTRKQRRLTAGGWKVGTARELLRLPPAEALLVEIKLALADAVRARRIRLGWTQQALATELGSSQSRVAKIEAGDRSVSVDLLVLALASLGATRRDVAKVIAARAA